MTNSFDQRAQAWDSNPMHWQRSEAIAEQMKQRIPLNKSMHAMEYGAGTGILSFLLKDAVGTICLMDNSREMVRVMTDKIAQQQVNNLFPQYANLETENYTDKQFDVIYMQMVLHHVSDYAGLLQKFSQMLTTKGYLAIADLYAEDGSFHGQDFDGHKGFDINALEVLLQSQGFTQITCEQCFVVNKKIDSGEIKPFPVFLLIAQK